jgi:phosphate transport system permease protein
VLHGVTFLAAAASVVLVGLIAWELVKGAWPAIERFGLGFLTSTTWDPAARQVFGAGTFIVGTAITSVFALLIAGPISIAIALYLTELAPRFLRGPVTALVETLAAVPSVIIGFWGILVLGPFLADTVEPALNDTLGFLPIFSGQPQASGLLPAIAVLTIMIIPIVTSISRELFLGVPPELKEGALALGLTRWEMLRAVDFPYVRGGLAAALILGLGRAVGEAIAVTQVIGNNVRIPTSIFGASDTLASRIASQYQGATTELQIASLTYLALILLVFSLVANVAARWIVRRTARRHTGAVGTRGVQ